MPPPRTTITFPALSSLDTSEDEDAVGIPCPISQLLEGTAATSVGQFGFGKSAGIHTCTANSHLSPAPRHRPEHQFEVVIPLRHYLSPLGAARRITEKKNAHMLAFPSGEGAGETEAVVTALGAVWRIVQHK
jgi:hypothetical protein